MRRRKGCSAARGSRSTECTTSVCVESTLRDAFYRDYQCLALTDCCAEAIGSEQARTNHDASLTVIEALFGWTAESTQFIQSGADCGLTWDGQRSR